MATSTNTHASEKTDGAGVNGFKIPGFDSGAILDSYKKNLEILELINKMSVEVFNGIMKLQTAFVKQAMSDFGSIVSSKPSEAVSKFSEVTRDSVVRAIGNSKQIADMITVANNDITAAASKRLKESIEEAKKAVKA
jgi:phasin family protein